MIDQQQSQPGQTATENTAASLQKPSQTVVESLLAIQALHLELAHSFLRRWMERLTLPWRQPPQQQAPFRRLMATPMQSYLDWMLAPLTLSRKLVEASLPTMQHDDEQVSQVPVEPSEAMKGPRHH